MGLYSLHRRTLIINRVKKLNLSVVEQLFYIIKADRTNEVYLSKF